MQKAFSKRDSDALGRYYNVSLLCSLASIVYHLFDVIFLGLCLYHIVNWSFLVCTREKRKIILKYIISTNTPKSIF